MSFLLLLTLWAAAQPSESLVTDQHIVIEGTFLKLVYEPARGGVATELSFPGVDHNLASGDGLLQEGFGVGSFYVPNRRLNEQTEILQERTDQPVFRHSYDCDGPNIKGLHVTRIIEPLPEEASIRVHWKVENRGNERQWVAPWIQNEAAPGGVLDQRDRIDIPTLDGVLAPAHTAYYAASRNWAAVTDPAARETVYVVSHADDTYAFLAFNGSENEASGFRCAFVPRVMEPGATWETAYRLNAVRGLSHVDFASDELAAQIDYQPGRLEVLMAAVRPMPGVEIHATVRDASGQAWPLVGKRADLNPGRPIRCTYEWAAPREGAYEFLAQLKQNGRILPLGLDTGSPHGGVDTQFVVRSSEGAAMPAWSDAPHALDHGGRTLPRDLALADGLALWFESPLNKIFREDVPEPTGKVESTARIALARGERESFQLVLRPPDEEDLDNVTIRVRDLVAANSGAVIPAGNITISNVAWHAIRVPTHFESATGLWPDALPAHKPFTAPGGMCSAVWLTVYAPPGTPPGTYLGVIDLSASGRDPVELWLEATVYDFDLPITPALKTDFGISIDDAYQACKKAGFSDSRDALASAYLADALRHRVTLRQLTSLPAESADYPTSLNRFAPTLDAARPQGATTFAVPPSLLDVPEQLRLADTFVVENGLQEQAFCPFSAEPLPPAWPRLFESMQSWRDNAPHVPIMVSTFGLQPFLPDALDIWNVHLQVFDTLNNKTILERIANGGEVWCYVNHAPPRPYGNFFIDFTAIEHRILFWQAWALGIKGFHYWDTTHIEPGRDPWLSQLDQTPANGNGSLVYPGPGGPVDSIRWEAIRDGIEDYDYLVVLSDRLRRLKERGGREVLVERAESAMNIQAVCPDLVSFPRVPTGLSAKREEIARVIEAIGRTLR